MNSLVRFWDKCDLGKPPYLHPEDQEIVAKNKKFFDRGVRTHRKFVHGERFGDFDDHRFHLSLLPVPYVGRLDTAEIVVLMLNPGFGLSEYFTGENDDYKRSLKRVIRQTLDGAEFPFVSLNPQFCWTGGFNWWEKKLRSTLTTIAIEKDITYLEAMKFLSKKLACIELVPYRSASFKGTRSIYSLPSVLAAKLYVRETLVPKALRGEIKLIATRKIAHWGLAKAPRHIIEYGSGQARGASLGPSTPGGKAILQQLGIRVSKRRVG